MKIKILIIVSFISLVCCKVDESGVKTSKKQDGITPSREW